MAHPLSIRAAKLVAQARALNDEFPDKAKMPAEVAAKIDTLLKEASNCRKQVQREQTMDDFDAWTGEPEYKHDMGPFGADDEDAKPGKKTGRPKYAIGDYSSPEEKKAAQKAAFFDYVRKGDRGAPEAKAALVEDATGQLLVPVDFAGTILKELPRLGVIRDLAFIRPTSSNTVDIGSVALTTAGWGKMETGTVPADPLAATPAAKDTITVQDLNALVKLGVDELEDADDDLAAVISEALSLKFAEQEDDAFANGSGTDRPKGLAIEAGITQGVASAVGETVNGDELKRTTFQVPAQFRTKARSVWLYHTSAEEKIALLKDADGRYLLQPNSAAGEPDTLFGYRSYTVDGLPAITATVNGGAAGTDKSVFFGDVKQGYMIVDRRRIYVQRLDELYAAEGKIGLLFKLRVGGGVIRPKAFAWYKL